MHLASINISATNGSVTQTGPGSNLSADNIAISASTGIGVATAPLTTKVSNLEAETLTGGIFINNTGNLTIGGVSGSLFGVRTLTSGDIQITNAGDVSITVSGDYVGALPGQRFDHR